MYCSISFFVVLIVSHSLCFSIAFASRSLVRMLFLSVCLCVRRRASPSPLLSVRLCVCFVSVFVNNVCFLVMYMYTCVFVSVWLTVCVALSCISVLTVSMLLSVCFRSMRLCWSACLSCSVLSVRLFSVVLLFCLCLSYSLCVPSACVSCPYLFCVIKLSVSVCLSCLCVC